MADDIQPLANNFAIVDATGKPTEYFIRWAQERSIDISEGVSAAQVQELIDQFAAGREIIAGAGLTGGGPLSADVTLDVGVGTGLAVSADAVRLADTAVVPGTYGDATHSARMTVDQQGRVTAASEVAISGGGGGGGSNVVVKALFKWSPTGVISIVGGKNVASIVAVASGQYQVTFTTPINPGCIPRSVGKFDTYPDYSIMVVGAQRSSDTTTTQTTFCCGTIGSTSFFPPNANGVTPGSGYVYLEVVDPTIMI